MIIFKISKHLFLSLLFLGCAKNLPPTGGEINKPLFYIKKTSIIDSSLNVPRYVSFRFQFNDWITKKIQDNDILIIPSIQNKFNLSIRSDNLNIKLRNPLVNNTTYTLSFRQSLKSIRNQNLIKEQSLVFSTGNQIDKGKIQGKIKTTTPSLTYIGLYPHEISKEIATIIIAPNQSKNTDIPNLNLERPYYTIPINKNGSFIYNSIKPGFYSVLAFVDLNKNLRPDIETEHIGVGPKKIWIGDSTSLLFLKTSKIIQTPVQINTIEWLPLKLEKGNTSKGLLKISFNQPILKTSFNPVIQDSIKKQLNHSQVHWYDNNQKVFLTLDQPISKDQKYQIYFEKLFSLSYQKINSTQKKLYFKYDSLFFERTKTYTPDNFAWKQNHLSSQFRYIFESNYYLSDSLFIELKKSLTSIVDTVPAPFFWRKLNEFHFELIIKKIQENNQKLYFTLSSKDLINADSTKLDTLGFVNLKENDKQGFVEVHLPKSVLLKNPFNWKYQIKAKKSNQIFIDAIPLKNLQNQLDTLGPFDVDFYDISIFYDDNNNGLVNSGSVTPWFHQETYINISQNTEINNKTIVSVQPQ